MEARESDRVKPVVSLFSADASLFGAALKRLEGELGPVDLLSEPFEFGSTEYYEEEFGPGLLRRLASFEKLIDPTDLVRIKLFTNSMEKDFSVPARHARHGRHPRRRINIDPGYVALEKFVLASCKNFSHRIYLGSGVWADLTLIYRAGKFRALEWSYPDYRETAMTALLEQVRNRYAFVLGRGLKIG